MPSQLITIRLEDLQFYSFHGLYPEEKITGGNFIVNLAASFALETGKDSIEPISAINQTVNYASIYEVVSRIMMVPHELLETVAMEIASVIQKGHPELSSIEVIITKCKPPIPGMTGSSSVQYNWER